MDTDIHDYLSGSVEGTAPIPTRSSSIGEKTLQMARMNLYRFREGLTAIEQQGLLTHISNDDMDAHELITFLLHRVHSHYRFKVNHAKVAMRQSSWGLLGPERGNNYHRTAVEIAIPMAVAQARGMPSRQEERNYSNSDVQRVNSLISECNIVQKEIEELYEVILPAIITAVERNHLEDHYRVLFSMLGAHGYSLITMVGMSIVQEVFSSSDTNTEVVRSGVRTDINTKRKRNVEI